MRLLVAAALIILTTLGVLNSRIKDYYDLALLSRMYLFEGELLAQAVGATFHHQRTAIEAEPIQESTAMIPREFFNGVHLCAGAGSEKRQVT